MRIAYWVVVPVVGAVCVAFAISNRAGVTLALWPLPFAVALPLYLLVFAALVVGFAVGAVAAWLGGRHKRRRLRRCRRRVAALESELAAAQAPPAGRAAPGGVPARG
jgi:lipopolysaccharide assembly protein A